MGERWAAKAYRRHEDHFAAQDDLAERIKALDGHANGHLSRMLSRSKVAEAGDEASEKDMLTSMLRAQEALASTVKASGETAARTGDTLTEDLCIARGQIHEKFAWMLQAHLRWRGRRCVDRMHARAPATPPRLQSMKERIKPMEGATISRSLLIVDGDDALRGQLAVAMARQGFRVRTAACVSEALEAIDAQIPAFAILDLRFRDGSGLDLAERILRDDNGARVVILTGFGDIQTAVAATRLGVTDYLTKPATPDEIIDALVVADGTYPPAPRATVSPDEARNHHIAHVFRETGRNITQTARRLNMHRRTLQRILKRNGVLNDATG